MKKTIIFLALVLVPTTIAATLALSATPGPVNSRRNDTGGSAIRYDSTDASKARRKTVQDPPGTIKGSVHPELIPDRVAHTMLFLVLADRNTHEERAKARAYLGRFSPRLSDSDMEAIIAAANEYWREVAVLNAQAKTIKDKHWPKPEPRVLAALRELQTKKDKVVNEVTASLHQTVSHSGRQTIVKQILPYIKSRMKLSPEPRSLPGGEDWHPAWHISKMMKGKGH